MLKQIIQFTRYNFGIKDVKKAFFDFLNLQAGAVFRGAPQFRQRKYLNVQISQKFKQMEIKRKQQRLGFAQKRKKLLQQKISNQAKLLTDYQNTQLTKIRQQIKTLQTIISEQDKQLQQLNKNLQASQADFILVQGMMKLVVLNQIKYLQHINQHPSGVVLTPIATKTLQNIHYLVTHNLPVMRYKLYQLTPSLFTKEISQLEESARKLIQENSLNVLEEKTSDQLRRFAKREVLQPRQYELMRMRQEKENIVINMYTHANQLVNQHAAYFQSVKRGQTPFRNFRHLITVLLSEKLKLNLTAEEQKMRQTFQEIFQNLQDFETSYMKDYNERRIQVIHSYIDPPPYIANHPVLLAAYDKYMDNFTNPVFITDIPNLLPDKPHNDDGRAFMRERIQKQIQKLDQQFVRLFNTDRQLLISRKKQYELEFYNISTKILQQYQAQKDKSIQQQQFQKLPKRPKKKEDKFVRITMDQLIKAIYLNNSDKQKYSLDFFAKYFGMEQNKKDLLDALNSISYLRVLAPDQGQQTGKKQVSQSVIKFIS